MPNISKIEQQKRNKNRFNIYLSDEGKAEEYGFSVDEDLLVRLRLSKGMEVDELAIMEIQYRDHVQKAFQSAVHFLSYRMRSEREIAAYLAEKEWEEAVIDEAMHKLREYKYVNDEEYAKAYVRTQMNIARKGPDLIKRELSEKGISVSMQDEALEQYTPALQWENAEALAQKSLKKSKGSHKEAKQKAVLFLTRKGYNMGLAASVADELASVDEDSEWESLVLMGQKFHRKYAKLEEREYGQKMKTALFRKGFQMDLINKFVELGKEQIDNQEYEL